MRGEVLLATLLASALLVPAHAAGATARAGVALLGGGVAATAPADVELPAARVSGSPVTVEAPVGPFVVTDTRPGSAGWSLVVVATAPADPLGRPLGAPLVVTPRPAAVGGAGTVPGAAGPVDAPRAILTAPPGTGSGRVEVTPLVGVTVPGDAATAVYSATLVVTVS
ncbi:MAG: hypothetical protein AB7V62_03100 [Thermoleophilia bacterium]